MSRAFLTSIDLSKNQLLNVVLQNLASAPSSPVAGQMYYDTTLNQQGYYNGTGWIYPGTGGGSGTVTTVSVATANGFAGTVANATSTPQITLTTSVTGLLKGNGTAISAATSGTDYAPATSGTAILKGNGSGGFTSATSGTDYAPATSGTGILKGNGSGGFSTAVSNTDYAPVASPTFTGTVTVPTPSVSTAAATKGYVDSVAQGLNVKNSAVAATTGAETYTIASGSVTQITGTTVDGISPAVNDYILIKDAPAASGAGSANSTEPGNGLYQVTSNTTNLAVSRAADMSGSNGPAGAFVFVQGGTVNASSGWVVSVPATNSGFTYGTNNIKWTQFSGAGEITAGTGLAKSGNTLSIENSGVLLVTHGGTGASTAAGAKTNLGFAGVYNSGTIGNGSSSSITVTHNLNNSYPLVQVYLVSSGAQVVCDVVTASVNAVTLTFSTAPASNSIQCVVVG